MFQWAVPKRKKIPVKSTRQQQGKDCPCKNAEPISSKAKIAGNGNQIPVRQQDPEKPQNREQQ